jgi:trk system potassium uptake protein
LLLLGAVLIYAFERNNPVTLGKLDGPTQALSAFFASVNTRSAGFNSFDISALSPPAMALHYVLMFIGGGSAGTAGGVKVATFMIILLIIWNEWRGHQDVEFGKRRIAGPVQRQAITMVFTVGAVIVVGSLLILPQVPRLPFHSVVFEVISAACTVGLSMGITAQLPPAAQFILVVLMFLGRVGVVALAAALAINHARRGYRYPEEKPIVG